MTDRTLGNICADGRKVALAPDAKVREAADLMKQQVIGAVMIMQDGALRGILSERDIVTRVVAEGRDPVATEVRDVMTRDVTTAPPDTPAIRGLHMMREGGFRHLPVATERRVVGLVSLRDFMGDEMAEVQDEESFETAVTEELW